MNDLDNRKAILKLLESASLPPEVVDSFFEKALDINYWRRLNPELTIESGEKTDAIESTSLTPQQIATQLQKVRREGYFQTGSVIDPELIGRMRAAVESVRRESWPHVFSWVYDEYWQVVRSPSLTTLLSEFLGKGYSQNAHFWTYYVEPVNGAEGWPPHADAGTPDNDSRLTVWIPLSAATLENGCMYLIPRDRMPQDVPRMYRDITSVNNQQLGRLLQGAKALPSPAGALLGWNHETIHWGSRSNGSSSPRISIAAEFISRGAVADPSELPLFDIANLPSFPERIRTIAGCLLDYGRFEPSLRRYSQLGHRLRDNTCKFA